MPEKSQPQTFPVELNELNRRVRMMEIKMDKIEERLVALEKALEQIQTDFRIMKDLNEKKISDIKNEISTLNEKIETISKKSEQFVTKTEFQKIKMFIDIVNPLTSSFVTKDELESKIDELKKSVLKQENKI
jgi:predicted  nucleic acid-binding Zn-ribbon protein